MITIGITTYNGSWRLGNLLKSISMRTPELAVGIAQVVVVDDGSPTPGTRRVVEEWAHRFPITFVEHGKNRGISAGWNTAVRALQCEYAVLVNDDVIVSEGWLRSLIHVLENSPGVGCVGQNWHAFLVEDVVPLLESSTSDRNVIPRDPVSKSHVSERRDLERGDPGRVMAPTGQLFAFRRKDFDAIGGFDETYKSFYEESCFNTSMAQRGLIGVQLNWPFNWHMWSATFGANPELEAGNRMAASRAHYRQKWAVPEGVYEFDYTNPKYLGAIGDVEVKFLREGQPASVVLPQPK
jgi:hypothetical protein